MAKNKPVYSVSEMFETYYPDFLEIISEEAKVQFLNDWYQLAKLCNSALFSADTWQDCDLVVKGTVDEILQDRLLPLLWESRHESLLMRVLTELFESTGAMVDFYAPDDNWKALNEQFAKVFYQNYRWSPVYKLQVFVTYGGQYGIDFADDAIVDLLAYAHGLAEDEWGLQYYGMPEFRWANDGKGKFAWYPLGEVVQLGTSWYTKKYRNKIQLPLKGF